MPPRQRTSRSDNVSFSVRVSPALQKRVKLPAAEVDLQACFIVREALERSLDEIRTSPTIAGRPNKLFVSDN